MRRKNIIGLHYIIWLLIFLNQMLPYYFKNQYRYDLNQFTNLEVFTRYLLINLGYLINNIIAFYVTAYVIAPILFKHKKWVKATFYTFLLLSGITLLRYLTEYKIYIPFFDFDNYNGKSFELNWYIRNSILYMVYSYFIYGIIFFLVMEWYRGNQRQSELEKEKISAELAFLKSQINPHFLFNTLNDIYALTYKKSDQAPEAVLKLSELLRYMLKESDEDFADLEKEIQYVKNVIQLHKIGQKNQAYINFKVNGDPENWRTPPLMLINFVENAFKHGVFDDPQHPIQINLSINHNYLHFQIRNKKNQDEKDRTSGIGLLNVQRRLSLIYPEKHTLTILNEDHYYSVDLKIEMI